jgi:hypothetical protein
MVSSFKILLFIFSLPSFGKRSQFTPSPARGGLGWGWVRIIMQRQPDALLYSMHLYHNLMVPKSYYPEACLPEKKCPFVITKLFVRMLSAINLNNQFLFEANKIKNVLVKWMLSPVFVPLKLSAS